MLRPGARRCDGEDLAGCARSAGRGGRRGSARPRPRPPRADRLAATRPDSWRTGRASTTPSRQPRWPAIAAQWRSSPQPKRSSGNGSSSAAARRPNAVTGPISTKRVSRTSDAGRRRVTFQAEWLRSVCAGCARSRPNALTDRDEPVKKRAREAARRRRRRAPSRRAVAGAPRRRRGCLQHPVQVLELPAASGPSPPLCSRSEGSRGADRAQRDAHVVAALSEERATRPASRSPAGTRRSRGRRAGGCSVRVVPPGGGCPRPRRARCTPARPRSASRAATDR